MVTKTITEQRADVHIFAGNDPAHTATGVSGITSATPALTPLMLDDSSGRLIVWDGQKAGTAVGVLTLPLTGTESVLTFYKTGTFATDALCWPDDVNEVVKSGAFVGSAISHA
ncbi:TPA: head decoration protein [Escherichia coli]|nr:head decoration protein [Escherichia coli]HAY0219015.1 head decoration protein [Escherichia coli]HEL7978451.1 head decoration protein [Escherichia coli]HEL7988078.1 head decoration protein [Escherichia coli]HEL8021143.1 head decoration protein [Escherichia coli]